MAKTFIQELMSDNEGRKLYFREDLIFEMTEAICKVMEEKHISKAELSRLASVSKSNITQLLSGDQNMRLSTVADLLYALDSRLAVTAVPLDIDSILEGTTFDQWAPAMEATMKQFEYQEINKKDRKEITQAA
jgi:predicted transcriptional regulator